MKEFIQRIIFKDYGYLFFWTIIPVLYLTSFYYNGIRLTCFEFLFPILLYFIWDELKKYKILLLFLITFFVLHAIYCFLFLYPSLFLLIKETIKYSYFVSLLFIFYVFIKGQDISKIKKYYHLGYITIVYAVFFTILSWEILRINVAIRTPSSGLIVSYFALILFFMEKEIKNICIFIFMLSSCILISGIFGWGMLLYDFICFFLLIFSVYYIFKRLSKKKKIMLSVGILLGLVLVINKKSEFIENKTNILRDQGFIERKFIITESIHYILNSKKSILGFGAGQADDGLIERFNNHKKFYPAIEGVKYEKNQQMHNSFLSLIIHYGIFSIPFILFYIFMVFLVFIYKYEDIYLLLIMIAPFLQEVFFMHSFSFFIVALIYLSNNAIRNKTFAKSV